MRSRLTVTSRSASSKERGRQASLRDAWPANYCANNSEPPAEKARDLNTPSIAPSQPEITRNETGGTRETNFPKPLRIGGMDGARESPRTPRWGVLGQRRLLSLFVRYRGPGAGSSRARAAEGRRNDIDAARQRLQGWRGSKL